MLDRILDDSRTVSESPWVFQRRISASSPLVSQEDLSNPQYFRHPVQRHLLHLEEETFSRAGPASYTLVPAPSMTSATFRPDPILQAGLPGCCTEVVHV